MSGPGTPLPWRAVIWPGVGVSDTICIKADNLEIIHWAGFDGVPVSKAANRKNARYVAKACNAYPALLEEVKALREALALWIAYDDLDEADFSQAGPMIHYAKAINATRDALARFQDRT